MAIESILSQIDAEIARLTQARSLLANGGELHSSVGNKKSTTGARRKHVLSPEARKRIADAQRKRWAAQKAKK
jgi:hypothetical protein